MESPSRTEQKLTRPMQDRPGTEPGSGPRGQEPDRTTPSRTDLELEVAVAAGAAQCKLSCARTKREPEAVSAEALNP